MKLNSIQTFLKPQRSFFQPSHGVLSSQKSPLFSGEGPSGVKNMPLIEVLSKITRESDCYFPNGSLAKTLLRMGAHLDGCDSHGNTALMWAISQNNLLLTQALIELGANLDAKNNAGVTPLILAVRENSLEMVRSLVCQGASLELADKEGVTPLVHAIHHGNTPIAKYFIEEHLRRDLDINGGCQGLTPLMWAIKDNRMGIVQWLISRGRVNVNTKVLPSRISPLIIAIKGVAPLHSFDMVRVLLESGGADPNLIDKYGQTPLMWATKQDAYTVARELIKYGADIDAADYSGKTVDYWAQKLKKVGKPSIAELLLDVREDRAFSTQLGTPVADVFPAFSQGIRQKNESMILDHLPTLLFAKSLRFIQRLANELSFYMHVNPALRGSHPNEAEFMLFLRHPENIKRSSEDTAPITTALTSITQFPSGGSDAVVKAWSDIGLLTHAFRFWRYDAQYKKSSLLCKFGFQALPQRETDDTFGQGFLFIGSRPQNMFSSLEPKTLIEFRQGYLLVKHPEHGVLIIRNSSKKFGRDLLAHPAYYRSDSKIDLMTYEPQKDDQLQHILTPALYQDEGFEHHLGFLTHELLRLKEDYRRWKLDTKAFELQGGRKVFTGHHSPGLKPILEFIDYLSDFTDGPLPDLAFVHPDYPPFEPYTFEDRDGEIQSRFKITPQRLTELRDVVNKTWNETQYPHSDWVRFLNQAGVQNRGELVLLAPEK